MRSVTGIVSILPNPVLLSAWGACPLTNTPTAAATTLQFPDLQNGTITAFEGSNLLPAAKEVRSSSVHTRPAIIVLPGEMEKARKSETRKKPGGRNDH